MSSYSPKLARAFSDTGASKIASGLLAAEDHQVVAYVSRVAIELSMKALLEKAGVPEKTVRALSHDLPDLLKELDKCKVSVASMSTPVPASRVRAKEVRWKGSAITLGTVIDAELAGASTFPGQYRYGAPPNDYPAEVLTQAADTLCAWMEEHWNSITI